MRDGEYVDDNNEINMFMVLIGLTIVLITSYNDGNSLMINE